MRGENELLTILCSLKRGAVIVDNSYKIVDLSKEVEKILDRNEVIGKNIFSFIPEDYREEAKDAFERVKLEKRLVKSVILKDSFGKIHTCNLNIIKAGEFFIIFGEEEDQKMREFFRNMIDRSPHGMLITTIDGDILEVNERASEMFGYKKEELIGQNISILLPEKIKREAGNISSILRRKYLILEILHRHKKGHFLTLELTIFPFKIGGKEMAIVIVHDVSERKENEIRYRAIGEMARDAIIMVDSQGRVEYWNPAAEKIFGYTAEEIIGKEFFEYLVPEEEKERVKKIVERILSSGGEFKKYRIMEALGRRKNGEVFPFEHSPSVFTIHGKIHGLAIIRDISDRKRFEEKIIRQNKELQLLYNFSRSISELSLENIYRRSYEELRKIVNFDVYTIVLYDEKEGKLKVALSIEDGRDITENFKPFDLGDTITGWVVKNKKSLLIRNFKKEKGKLPAKFHIVGWLPGSWLGVPLLYKNRVIGAVVIQTKKENMFDENDKRLLETLAPQLAVAIMNAKLYTEIKMTKDRLENLINTSIVGVAITDLDDNLIFVNKKFAQMLGYDVNELIGKNIREITTEEGFQKIREGTKRRIREISDSYETVFLRKDGKHIDVLINASPLKDEGGNIVGTIGIFIDITERKRAEKIIREEREKYKKMMENLLVGIFIIQDEKIVYANKVLGDMLGYSVKELIGEHFTRMVHPDMREYVAENYRKRIRGEHALESYIVKMIRKNGDTIWALTKASIIEWEGRIADMVCVQDITEIKEMSDSLITLVKTFEEIKLAKSEDEIYNIALKTLQDVFHFPYASILKVVGKELQMVKSYGYSNPNIVLPLDGNRGITVWVVKNKKPYYASDVTKDSLYIEGVPGARCEYATPISAKDKVYGVLDVQRDNVNSISENERLLLDMLASHIGVALAGLESLKDLERSRNIQELMVHIISHDLKNPLAVLSGYIDLMREVPSEEFLDGMEEAIKEGENIIERARLFSKLEKKKVGKKEKIDLRKLIEDVSSTILRKYKNVKLVNNVGEITIYGYPILQEVFINLIDNAFKYGATKVVVDAKEEDHIVEVRVSDNGPGISDDKKEKIFEAFERASNIKGSGLGLTIVKMIVELHDGEVWVEDNKPKGSVFVVRLPKE